MATSRWPLLTLCFVFACWIAASFFDSVGFGGGAPWFGWWDIDFFPTSQPYVLAFDPPQPGGASAKAGIHAGDWFDLREQSLPVRQALFAQPLAATPIALTVHRGSSTYAARVVPSTNYDGDRRLKFSTMIIGMVSELWFIACATLIALRRASLSEGRLLVLALLCESVANIGLGAVIVVPDAALTMWLFAVPPLCQLGAMALLVALSARFGTRAPWRRILESMAYATIALGALNLAVFLYSLVTLRGDPITFGQGNLAVGTGLTFGLAVVASVAVACASLAAVLTTARSERIRAAWLLLPLPVVLILSRLIDLLGNYARTWTSHQGLIVLGTVGFLLGGFVVTYALLKRRVLDFEFVLGRTLVVATISLIVVVSFVLLEWLLGTVLTDVSHATGLIANAGLALALGLSMRYIHKRVDEFVDATLFRKRHEDERALLDFSKEAAYVTEPGALLDHAIAKVRKHTDARSGALLIDGSGAYEAARSFGVDSPANIPENDGAILALKAWHKPLDPHRYATDMHGALALPMLARGRLLGVVLLGERAGGEAYAPDEVEALAQFAHGVGSAFESMSANAARDASIERTLDLILTEVRSMREKGE